MSTHDETEARWEDAIRWAMEQDHQLEVAEEEFHPEEGRATVSEETRLASARERLRSLDRWEQRRQSMQRKEEQAEAETAHRRKAEAAVETLQGLFGAHDANGDGVLQPEELATLLKAYYKVCVDCLDRCAPDLHPHVPTMVRAPQANGISRSTKSTRGDIERAMQEFARPRVPSTRIRQPQSGTQLQMRQRRELFA